MTQTTNSLVFVPVAGSTTTRMFPSSPQSPSVLWVLVLPGRIEPSPQKYNACKFSPNCMGSISHFESSWQARKEERTENFSFNFQRSYVHGPICFSTRAALLFAKSAIYWQKIWVNMIFNERPILL